MTVALLPLAWVACRARRVRSVSLAGQLKHQYEADLHDLDNGVPAPLGALDVVQQHEVVQSDGYDVAERCAHRRAREGTEAGAARNRARSAVPEQSCSSSLVNAEPAEASLLRTFTDKQTP